jgi:hypothetical protein
MNETSGEWDVSVEIPVIRPTDLRKSLAYSRDYRVIANTLLNIVVPFIALIVINSSIYYKIRKNVSQI